MINSNKPGKNNNLALIAHGHFSVNLFRVSGSAEAHSRYHFQGCSENSSLEKLSLVSP